MTEVFYHNKHKSIINIFFENNGEEFNIEVIDGIIPICCKVSLNDFKPFGGITTVEIGKIYPRIRRGGITFEDMNSFVDNYYQIYRDSMMTAEIFVKQLKEIFETIHPVVDNMNSYGSKIRNLLLLSSMEVESSFKGILKENQYIQDRYSTKDFVKLLPALKLNEYSVKWIEYPNIKEQKPFEDWDSVNPTTSLDWYNSYNATKHDREKELNKASLEMAIKSISAMIILLDVQFGVNANINGISIKKTPEFYIKDLEKQDKWDIPGEGLTKTSIQI